MMVIRELKQTESDFLAEMLYQAIFIPEGAEPLPREVIEHESLSKYIDHWGKDEFDIAFVMEYNDQLIGAIWGRLFTQENKGFGYVDDYTPELSMAVRSEFRNQGIGTKLLMVIESEYQKTGVTQLSLSVDKANPASHLYQRLGYEIVEETKTSWTMKKVI